MKSKEYAHLHAPSIILADQRQERCRHMCVNGSKKVHPKASH